MATINVSVAADDDDGTRHSSAGYISQVAIGNLAGFVVDAYCRFELTIPIGATADVANIKFTSVDDRSATDVLTNIFCEAADDAAQITNTSEFDTALGNLTSGVPWDNVPAWSTDESGADTTTADFAAVLQEVLDRGGRSETFHVNVFIRNDGSTSSASRQPYEHEAAGAPAEIHVEFTAPAADGDPVPGGHSQSYMVYR